MYFHQKSLYSFGYGLSYTTFSYSNLTISSIEMKRDGKVTVSVDVHNSGARTGDDVVQLYVAHVNSKVERPIEELKGFKRITLRVGETTTIHFTLKADALAYWNVARGSFEVEPGQLNVMIGSSSADIKLKQILDIGPN
jgi:beta-glucosidase